MGEERSRALAERVHAELHEPGQRAGRRPRAPRQEEPGSRPGPEEQDRRQRRDLHRHEDRVVGQRHPGSVEREGHGPPVVLGDERREHDGQDDERSADVAGPGECHDRTGQGDGHTEATGQQQVGFEAPTQDALAVAVEGPGDHDRLGDQGPVDADDHEPDGEGQDVRAEGPRPGEAPDEDAEHEVRCRRQDLVRRREHEVPVPGQARQAPSQASLDRTVTWIGNRVGQLPVHPRSGLDGAAA